MKTRPILFSAPMIRALLERRKTQTRRILNPQPKKRADTIIEYDEMTDRWLQVHHKARCLYIRNRTWRCPYGKPGDRLWCRETWAPEPGFEYKEKIPRYDGGGIDRIVYRADETDGRGEPDGIPLIHGVKRWRPAIFMPRWGSRITLAVTNIRVERLHDVTEADARAEGMPPVWVWGHAYRHPHWSYRQGFAEGWDRINGKRAPWKSNPWLFVVSFVVDEAEAIDESEPCGEVTSCP